MNHKSYGIAIKGHYRKECPKLKNQNYGNKDRKKTEESRRKAYLLRGREANPDSNVFTGSENFVVYCDASRKRLGAVLMQRKKVIAYARHESVVFTDHKSLQHILDHKELNMRQRRWLELLSDYDCEIRYHSGKANMVVDALSHKERIKPL
nr:putative reverse transcriptase domain-containing protein [Tanacetum cinerariifolium]